VVFSFRAVVLFEGSVLYRLATTHRWIASPLVELPCLAEFFDRRRYHAYWVSVNPLCRCPDPFEPHALAVGYRREDSTLGFLRRRPYHGSTRGRSSLRLWLPYRVSPVHHREPVRDRLRSRWSTPSEVSSPSASLSHEELHSPTETHPGGCVASSGFRTLPTPCSPHGLPGLFHPGSAHGVWPFEALLLVWCRTPSRTPRPSGFLLISNEKRPPFQGLTHQTKHIRRPGYQPSGCSECLLGLFRFEASCPWQRRTFFPRPCIPSRAFPTRPHADRAADAPGYSLPRAQPLSLEIG